MLLCWLALRYNLGPPALGVPALGGTTYNVLGHPTLNVNQENAPQLCLLACLVEAFSQFFLPNGLQVYVYLSSLPLISEWMPLL